MPDRPAAPRLRLARDVLGAFADTHAGSYAMQGRPNPVGDFLAAAAKPPTNSPRQPAHPQTQRRSSMGAQDSAGYLYLTRDELAEAGSYVMHTAADDSTCRSRLAGIHEDLDTLVEATYATAGALADDGARVDFAEAREHLDRALDAALAADGGDGSQAITALASQIGAATEEVEAMSAAMAGMKDEAEELADLLGEARQKAEALTGRARQVEQDADETWARIERLRAEADEIADQLQAAVG